MHANTTCSMSYKCFFNRVCVQGQHAKNGSSVTSECSWYFVIYSVDSTLGMVLVLIAHEVCLNMARARINGASQQHDTRGTDLEVFNSNSNSIGNQNRSARRRKSMCRESSSEYQWVFEYISDCGSYGDPPDFYKWAVQVCFALTLHLQGRNAEVSRAHVLFKLYLIAPHSFVSEAVRCVEGCAKRRMTCADYAVYDVCDSGAHLLRGDGDHVLRSSSNNSYCTGLLLQRASHRAAAVCDGSVPSDHEHCAGMFSQSLHCLHPKAALHTCVHA